MDIISYAKACKAGGGGDKYQEKLVSGQNIKTVNGQDILGAGNLAITTYQSFNTNWTTSDTIDAFCANVDADASAVEGMAYLGELTCSDLPFAGNADTVVEVMSGSGTSGKAIHITITSGDIVPHRWDYTYWNNGQKTSGWVAAAQVEANPTMTGTEDVLSGIEINGTKYTVGSNKKYYKHSIKLTGVTIDQSSNISLECEIINSSSDLIDTKSKLYSAINTHATPTNIYISVVHATAAAHHIGLGIRAGQTLNTIDVAYFYISGGELLSGYQKNISIGTIYDIVQEI